MSISLQSYESANSRDYNEHAFVNSTLDDFEIIKKLGDGSYSQVFLVKRVKDRRLYALKKV